MQPVFSFKLRSSYNKMAQLLSDLLKLYYAARKIPLCDRA
jgi:threonine dehydratase